METSNMLLDVSLTVIMISALLGAGTGMALIFWLRGRYNHNLYRLLTQHYPALTPLVVQPNTIDLGLFSYLLTLVAKETNQSSAQTLYCAYPKHKEQVTALLLLLSKRKLMGDEHRQR